MRSLSRGYVGVLAVLVVFTVGTAEAEMPDILGVQLGMPVRDAYAKLQAQLPMNKIQVESVNLPTIEKPVIASFGSAPVETIMMGMEADQVRVDATLPPNKQTVWRIERTHFFPNKGIPKATLLVSLREKYGKESRAMSSSGKPTNDEGQIVSLLWLMDEQGRPGTLPPLSTSAVDPLWTCTSVADGNRALLVKSPPPNYGNKNREWCLSSYTAVLAQSSPGMLPELFDQLRVVVVSLPLASRAGIATMKWKNEIAEGQHKQDLEKAKQQDKPKL